MAINKDLLVMLKSNGLGDGEPDLGEKLMNAFLNMLLDSGETPAQIICMNSAVYLTTENSPVLETMREFEKAGARILSCGTCLDYYGRKDKLEVGSVTNMRDTVTALLGFGKIVSL